MMRFNSASGLLEFVHDEMAGKMYVTQTQDVEPVLNNNAENRMDSDGFSASRELRHRARIPLVLWVEWTREMKARGIEPWMKLERWAFVNRKLQDIEYNKLLASKKATRVGYN